MEKRLCFVVQIILTYPFTYMPGTSVKAGNGNEIGIGNGIETGNVRQITDFDTEVATVALSSGLIYVEKLRGKAGRT